MPNRLRLVRRPVVPGSGQPSQSPQPRKDGSDRLDGGQEYPRVIVAIPEPLAVMLLGRKPSQIANNSNGWATFQAALKDAVEGATRV